MLIGLHKSIKGRCLCTSSSKDEMVYSTKMLELNICDSVNIYPSPKAL